MRFKSTSIIRGENEGAGEKIVNFANLADLFFLGTRYGSARLVSPAKSRRRKIKTKETIAAQKTLLLASLAPIFVLKNKDMVFLIKKLLLSKSNNILKQRLETKCCFAFQEHTNEREINRYPKKNIQRLSGVHFRPTGQQKRILCSGQL